MREGKKDLAVFELHEWKKSRVIRGISGCVTECTRQMDGAASLVIQRYFSLVVVYHRLHHCRPQVIRARVRASVE